MLLRLYLLFLAIAVVKSDSFNTIDLPDISFDDIGGRMGILGSYESLSYYSYVNASLDLSITSNSNDSKSSNTPNNLFLRDLEKGYSKNFASVNGPISDVKPAQGDTILINGDFSIINNQPCLTPVIYNLTSNSITNIFQTQNQPSKRDNSSSSSSSASESDLPQLESGSVKTTFIDGDLIYFGGDFKFNDTYGAAIYDTTTQQLVSTPFKGFGVNSSVSAITKIFDSNDNDDDDDIDAQLGSIIFGGTFNTLGMPELLMHNLTDTSNTTNRTNSTNTTLINAEQLISLKHGDFSQVNNADGADPSALVCPTSSGSPWSLQNNQGGQWKVELPNAMKGIVPTKVRLYIPEGEDGIQNFRIYSYPNNGIMNLTYIDPESNEMAYCDSSCPLSTLQTLDEATENNLDEIDDLNVDEVFIGENDGTYSKYYDPSTETKTLSYAKNYQEFAFEDDISIDELGLTVISWRGSKASLAGLELYLNSIYVYGNETLNEPNCPDTEGENNYVVIDSGDFKSIHDVNPPNNVNNDDYLVSVGNTNAKLTLFPNITYSGDYSIIMLTPGCVPDGSCDLRSVITVNVKDDEDNVVSSKEIYQNNDYEKFDYLFYGHLVGSLESEGQTKIEIEYNRPISGNEQDSWLVVDKIRADIVSLDEYYGFNSTNRTNTDYKLESDLQEIKINGLFEYSLANFSSFERGSVYERKNSRTYIGEDNTFVGNSSINAISGSLTNDSSVAQLQLENSSDSQSLLIIGNLNSNTLDLPNNNVLNLKIESYNSDENATLASYKRSLDESSLGRSFDLDDDADYEDDFVQASVIIKRDQDSDNTIFGGNFNDTINQVKNLGSSRVMMGKFSMNNEGNSSVEIKDLSNDNETVSSANNFVIYDGEEFYSFGNEFINEEFDGFAEVEVDEKDYFVFSASSTGFSQTWDNTNGQWVEDKNDQLHITQAVKISDNQQILTGSSFTESGFTNNDQAFIKNNKQEFSRYNLQIEDHESTDGIRTSFYINESTSVIGGYFQTENGYSNVGFLSNSENNTFKGIDDNVEWSNDTMIQALYVDSESEYLVIGYNGSVTVNDEDMSSGILVYSLQNNSFSDLQPASLSLNNEEGIQINTIVLHNNKDKLFVGGDFSNAGSLGCEGLCVYDMKTFRWENPNSEEMLSGVVTDMSFHSVNGILISGNLTYNDENVGFISYDVDDAKFSTVDDINSLKHKSPVERFILCNEGDDKLEGQILAYGATFISGFDKYGWSNILGINYDNYTQFTDMKLLSLKEETKNNSGRLFPSDKILAITGRFELSDYGLVNMALYDGNKWTPYMFSSTDDNQQLGTVNSLLIKDNFRFLSLQDVKEGLNDLSVGKVVGISLGCALGSTTLLSLLYIIPYLAFFRKNNKDDEINERIGEREMMDAVNPQELLHEIDVQKNN